MDMNMTADHTTLYWKENGNDPIHILDVEASKACSSASMVDCFYTQDSDHFSDGQNLSYSCVDVPNDSGTLGSHAPSRADFGLNSNQLWKGSMLLQALHGRLSWSLSHFPSDSTFLEMSTRFPCFLEGDFNETVNPFCCISDPWNGYLNGLASAQRPDIVLGGCALASLSGLQLQRHDLIMADQECHNKADPICKNTCDVSKDEPDGAECSNHGSRQTEEVAAAFGASCRGFSSRKRERTGTGQIQDTENDENKEIARQSSVEAGKNHIQTKRVADRRGQATNSHSLAERARREKISKRMKYLQELVPDCSKVTGKAMMLDEIISYVQSLQRQVEFLSMRLATENPQLAIIREDENW